MYRLNQALPSSLSRHTVVPERRRGAEGGDVEEMRAHGRQPEQARADSGALPALADGPDAIRHVGQVHEEHMRAALRSQIHVLVAREGGHRCARARSATAQAVLTAAGAISTGISLDEFLPAMGGGVVVTVGQGDVEVGVETVAAHRGEAAASGGRLRGAAPPCPCCRRGSRGSGGPRCPARRTGRRSTGKGPALSSGLKRASTLLSTSAHSSPGRMIQGR